MIEGWAVYTEQMMLDQGYGEGNLQLRLNQLKFYLRAVCNAILDHKLHAGTMTDDEALRLMVDGAFQSQEEASLKLVRAKQTSTLIPLCHPLPLTKLAQRPGVPASPKPSPGWSVTITRKPVLTPSTRPLARSKLTACVSGAGRPPYTPNTSYVRMPDAGVVAAGEVGAA